jgi:hypothetical protein
MESQQENWLTLFEQNYPESCQKLKNKGSIPNNKEAAFKEIISCFETNGSYITGIKYGKNDEQLKSAIIMAFYFYEKEKEKKEKLAHERIMEKLNKEIEKLNKENENLKLAHETKMAEIEGEKKNEKVKFLIYLIRKMKRQKGYTGRSLFSSLVDSVSSFSSYISGKFLKTKKVKPYSQASQSSTQPSPQIYSPSCQDSTNEDSTFFDEISEKEKLLKKKNK